MSYQCSQIIADTLARVERTRELIERSKRHITETKVAVGITHHVIAHCYELLPLPPGIAVFAEQRNSRMS